MFFHSKFDKTELQKENIPFDGPIAGVTVGRSEDGTFMVNPTPEQLDKSDLNLVVAGTKDAINMVEAGADEVPEEVMLEAIMFGHEEIKRLIAFQEEIVAKVGKEKREVVLKQVDAELEKEKTISNKKGRAHRDIRSCSHGCFTNLYWTSYQSCRIYV